LNISEGLKKKRRNKESEGKGKRKGESSIQGEERGSAQSSPRKRAVFAATYY